MEGIIIGIFVIVILIRLFTMLAGVQRYREPGERVDRRNEDEYGTPARSYFTSRKIFTLHQHIDITDADEKVVYYSDARFLSLHDHTDVFRADGSVIAHISRKLLTLHELHYVEMTNGRSFQLSNEILHIIRDVTNIEGLGWVLEGNLLQLNFSLRDERGELIATVGQKLLSLHDKYSVDIYKTEYEEEVIAILIALQHMISDRQAASSSGGGASGSSSSS